MVVLEELKKSVNAEKRASLAKKLDNLAKRTGYEIIQTNGQRIYAPPANKNIKPPPKGCEIFIGRLTKYIFEDELIPLCETVAPLYKFRIMLDFTEKTRGYAFATYFTPEDADKAIARLNNYEIRPRIFIGVYKSVDNCRLFVGNIPEDITRDELLIELQNFAQGIIDVIMFYEPHNQRLNRGFVFVEFENHRFAAMARRQFTPNNLIIWGKQLYVDWADPLPVVDPKIMSKVTILYLNNLPSNINSEETRSCICKLLPLPVIKKVYKNLSYAFVHFDNRSSAEFAFSKLQGLIINGNKIGVEWARPRQFCKKNRIYQAPENYCTSVPPSIRRLVYQQRNNKYSTSSSATNSIHNNSFSDGNWRRLSINTEAEIFYGCLTDCFKNLSI